MLFESETFPTGSCVWALSLQLVMLFGTIVKTLRVGLNWEKWVTWSGP